MGEEERYYRKPPHIGDEKLGCPAEKKMTKERRKHITVYQWSKVAPTQIRT